MCVCVSSRVYLWDGWSDLREFVLQSLSETYSEFLAADGTGYHCTEAGTYCPPPSPGGLILQCIVIATLSSSVSNGVLELIVSASTVARFVKTNCKVCSVLQENVSIRELIDMLQNM